MNEPPCPGISCSSKKVSNCSVDNLGREKTYWDPKIPWQHAHDPPRFLREDECPPWSQDFGFSEMHQKEEDNSVVETRIGTSGLARLS
jgi:hypothetical protein